MAKISYLICCDIAFILGKLLTKSGSGPDKILLQLTPFSYPFGQATWPCGQGFAREGRIKFSGL